MDRGDNKDPCLEEKELDLYDYVLVHTSIYLVCTMHILVCTVLTKTLQMMLYYVAYCVWVACMQWCSNTSKSVP
jgi:hypothetical protein